MYSNNLKGTLKTFNGKFEGFTYPTAAKCEEIAIFDQKQPFETKNATVGSVDHVPFLFKRYNNSF